MRRLKGRKPSPALIVAIAALCVGLVGTAVAGPIATDSRLSRADVKTVIKLARTLALRFDARFTAPIANNQITRREPGLSVKSAKSADSADSANTANSAKTADDAKTLEGIGSSAFSRQASSAIADDALVGESGTAREVDITAPQDGFLLIIASSDVFGTANDAYSCVLEVGGEAIPASHRTSELDGAENSEENCGTNTIAPVSAGAHNVKFNFTSIAATTRVDETELDVVFIPFAG